MKFAKRILLGIGLIFCLNINASAQCPLQTVATAQGNTLFSILITSYAACDGQFNFSTTCECPYNDDAFELSCDTYDDQVISGLAEAFANHYNDEAYIACTAAAAVEIRDYATDTEELYDGHLCSTVGYSRHCTSLPPVCDTLWLFNGDLDGDHDIDISDFNILASHWLETGSTLDPAMAAKGDLNMDGVINAIDMNRLVINMGEEIC